MLNQDKKILPVGVVTISLLVVALVLKYWPKSSCEEFEIAMGQGFFMRWQPPELLVVTADKQQLSIQADSKQDACAIAMNQIGKKH